MMHILDFFPADTNDIISCLSRLTLKTRMREPIISYFLPFLKISLTCSLSAGHKDSDVASKDG